ncbi:putative dual-specificity RNA methyltransferase RlmN [Gregarina niphandrodes]|uniref:Dual-specificity RNA methyltransferase RlmN n=1 Tax=Gregarina niphandrodes TaxID=110365 RepID=A0A023B6T5_GRENI|nr:putative dual-specificity RNA methyltransferase RlmN [Gregarina niphandrodes]EZG66683.1 putative dual-specificity RNA methyltransferase RlmN [Gregarina niphandrodes]|eukprot:XP_011130534.1 putative dual-specificity RNA methyltransferase RlmN [Gregarina niphandrodes]
MSRRLEWQSVFDEVLLRGLVVEGILSTEKRAKLLVAAASVPPREGACDAAYWFGICPDVGRAAAHVLEERSVRHMTSRVIHIETTSKGDTTKFVTELQDGLKIETCIMRKGTTRTRSTVCVSCQVGCSMACKFCATGTLGLLGNLTSGEIIEQFVRANALEPIRNVVYMGMGEPLANYAAVISSIHQLCEQKVHHVAPHRITLSTVGFDPRLIEDLINDVPDVSLALSLHAPNQLIRDQIVPTSTKVPLHSLLKAAFQFVDYQRALSAKKGKRQMLFIEYCMLRNVNDSENCAKELAQLLKPWKDRAIINLIPYNPTDVSIDFEPPDQTAVWRFHHILKSDHGFQAFVRQEHGQVRTYSCHRALKQRQVGGKATESKPGTAPRGGARIRMHHART